MAERKYSVAEIDRMRRSVELCYCYRGPQNPAMTEERLRTYMLNGTDPEELEEEARKVCNSLPWPAVKPGMIMYLP